MSEWRPCPYTGCDQDIPDDEWACRVHWYFLSPELRTRIYTTREAYLRDRRNPAKLAAWQAADRDGRAELAASFQRSAARARA